MTVVAMALLLCVRYDWWPLNRNLDIEHKLLLVVVSTLLLLAAGTCWLVRTLSFSLRSRRWSWFVAGGPAVIAIAGILAFVPGPSTFNDERAAFDNVARQVIETPTQTVGEIEIGTFDIMGVSLRSDGAVYFYDADTMQDWTTGWVYSPTRSPSYRRTTKPCPSEI